MTDRKITIAVGSSRNAKHWTNKECTWKSLLETLSESKPTRETHAEFMTMPKVKQDEIKDIGGFVGGTLSKPQRKKDYVKSRSLITLDLDYATPDFIDDFLSNTKYAACIYSTHKHTPENPRIRFVALLSRDVTPEEYQAVARKIAEQVGIEMCDPTTYDINRLMYWPSHSSDIEPVFKKSDGPALDPDKILATYDDWHDLESWPTSTKEDSLRPTNRAEAEDPLTKRGWIGAFCRTYTIQDAINKYLSDVYVEAGENRYTYTKGSTTNGAVVYDDKFMYSHHATDPTSLRLCNAYDLVRIHKFGEMDKGKPSNTKKWPSVEAMNELCASDPDVKAQMIQDQINSAQADFADNTESEDEDSQSADSLHSDELNNKLKSGLQIVPSSGKIQNTIFNFYTIMKYDPALQNIGGVNELSAMRTARGPLPWDDVEKLRQWTDADDAGLRMYIESHYGINHKPNCEDALSNIENERRFHPIRDYLNSLSWDGVKRVDTLLVDYLGAEDALHVREKTRKALTAAVKRIFESGCKFDYMLTLCGKQGIGKSTLLHKLGMEWYTDSVNDISGKNGYDAIQGKWIVEMAELTATRKADIEAVKQFISKQTDTYRKAFGHYTLDYPRQCIFVGTTNDRYMLRDPTGNRRYWIVDTGKQKPRLDVFKLDQGTIDQIWAEAVQYYKNGESLVLSSEAMKEEAVIQEEHQDEDPWSSAIADYLSKRIPTDYSKQSLQERQDWIKNYNDFGVEPKAGTVERTRVCARMILEELFCYDLNKTTNADARRVNQIMEKMKGWKAAGRCRVPPYGVQIAYIKDDKESNTPSS